MIRHTAYTRLGLAFAAAMALSTAARGDSVEPVKVFANWAQPPKSWLDDSGIMHGYAIDTAEAILKDAGIPHAFIGAPYPRAFEQTKACEGLMVGVFKSVERERLLAFSEPIVPDRVALVTRASDPFIYTKPEDLAGKTLTYLRGAVFGIELDRFKSVTLDQQASFEIMLKKLVAGRTDAAILSPREGVPTIARQAGVPMEALRIADEPLAVVPNHIVSCRNDAALTAIIAKLNRSIAKLRDNGTFARIMKSY